MSKSLNEIAQELWLLAAVWKPYSNRLYAELSDLAANIQEHHEALNAALGKRETND